MNNFKVLMNGIIKENPTFVLLLGMCPTLGTTSSAINGMGMGLATMFVLITVESKRKRCRVISPLCLSHTKRPILVVNNTRLEFSITSSKDTT